MLKRIVKILGWVLAILIVMIAVMIIYVRSVSVTSPPVPASMEAVSLKVTQPDSGLFTIGRNWFRQSESGLYELYVEGEAFERGVAKGKLTRDLVRYQEKVFNDQIETMVPSALYREMLKYFIGYFNRDLDKYVSEEYKLEIYGVSLSASDEYNDIASPYQRMLNYHAAHDIGHALQNMSLVGCTSFATWDDRSADGSLIIGRNFDFYVGDEFARDKIVAFYKPDRGYKFMMVTFGGMTGVLSGMNEAGLTVTINAAKSEIPGRAATPVSLVAREILQYAATIEEAYAIASGKETFVAESFLIGSARDGKAAIIEKSPDDAALFTSRDNYAVCTNHFQSEALGNTALNQEHLRTSASPYRYERVVELLNENPANNVRATVEILRNQNGKGDSDIGLGNEKLVNQLVAHHAIVFEPEKGLVWVSAAPWQLGKFVCYDLNKVFSLEMTSNREIYEADKIIEADPFLKTDAYRAYLKFSKFRFPFHPRTGMHPDSVVHWNESSYHAFMLAGDYLMEEELYERAIEMYEKGLTLEVATEQERAHMKENILKCKDKLR